MNANVDLTQFAEERYAVGQPVPRKEDPVLLRGEGRYSDDLNLPGQAHAVMVRSNAAHGIIRAIDTSAAKAMPGVLAVLTGQDLIDAGLGDMPSGMAFKMRDGADMPKPTQPILTTDKVRFVGDPVAVVVAETAAAGQGRAPKQCSSISTRCRPSPTPPPPPRPARRCVHDATPGNVILDFHHGDAAAVAAAFAKAAHVTAPENPQQPRRRLPDGAALGASASTTRRPSAGRCASARRACSTCASSLTGPLKAPVEKIRVLTGNVGGSFGMKSSCYPEYPAILHAARLLGRPVKWTDERSESFLSDSHGRDHDMEQEIALDAEGRILALRVTGYGNIGAYLSNGTVLQPTGNIVRNTIGVYATPLQEVISKAMFTNTSPVGPYRGAGRPEGNYYIERLLDTAAREMSIDPVDIRRRNHIQPDAFPYKTPAGTTYDSGDFPHDPGKGAGAGRLGRLPAAQEGKRRTRQAAGPRHRPVSGGHWPAGQGNGRHPVRGRWHGHHHHRHAGLRPGPRLAVRPGARLAPRHPVRQDQPAAGRLRRAAGRRRHRRLEIADGQRHRDRRRRGEGARGRHAKSPPTCWKRPKPISSSRSSAAAASSASPAPTARSASWNSPNRSAPARFPCRKASRKPCRSRHVAEGPPFAYPNGCHIAEVEVDPETGVTEVVSYHTVGDFGVVVNPDASRGPDPWWHRAGHRPGVPGARGVRRKRPADDRVIHGLRAAPGGRRADVRLRLPSRPARKTNLLGAKGCGEAGCAGALPSVMNALVDALSVYGIKHIDMPATPLRVWEAIQASA